MLADNVKDYIRKNLHDGHSSELIIDALIKAGYDESEVKSEVNLIEKSVFKNDGLNDSYKNKNSKSDSNSSRFVLYFLIIMGFILIFGSIFYLLNINGILQESNLYSNNFNSKSDVDSQLELNDTFLDSNTDAIDISENFNNNLEDENNQNILNDDLSKRNSSSSSNTSVELDSKSSDIQLKSNSDFEDLSLTLETDKISDLIGDWYLVKVEMDGSNLDLYDYQYVSFFDSGLCEQKVKYDYFDDEIITTSKVLFDEKNNQLVLSNFEVTNNSLINVDDEIIYLYYFENEFLILENYELNIKYYYSEK
jgi:hypothetical protein